MTRPTQQKRGRGHRYSAKIVRAALALVDRNKKLPLTDRWSLQDIADRVGVGSPQTILNWIRNRQRGVSPTKVLHRSPANRLLTIDQEAITAGYITLRSLNFFSTETRVARIFIHEHFGKSPNNTWMSRWAYRNHLSWKKVVRRTTNKRILEVRREISDFLTELNLLDKEPKKIICLDKAYLRSQAVNARELSPIGSGTPRRQAQKRMAVNTVYVGVVADGSQLPFYVELHKNPQTPIPFIRSGSHAVLAPTGKNNGETSMLQYLEWARTKRYISKGDILLMDNERALKTQRVQEYLEDWEIEVKYFPPRLGAIMNPCDNSFNALFKSEYYKRMSDLGDVDEQKIALTGEEAYYSPTDTAIENMFKHTGVTEGPPAKIAKRLVNEDNRLSGKNLTIHRSQIKKFLTWAKHHKIDIEDFRTRVMDRR